MECQVKMFNKLCHQKALHRIMHQQNFQNDPGQDDSSTRNSITEQVLVFFLMGHLRSIAGSVKFGCMKEPGLAHWSYCVAWFSERACSAWPPPAMKTGIAISASLAPMGMFQRWPSLGTPFT